MNLFKKIINNLHYVLIVYLISLIVSTILFHTIENKPLLDSFYWSCVTSLTIGYGDISPQSDQMRIIAVIFSHLWVMLLIPLVIGHVIVRLLEDKNVFTHEEQEEIKKNLKEINDILKNEKSFGPFKFRLKH